MNTSNPFSINIISTVTNKRSVQFMIYSRKMNCDRLIELIKQFYLILYNIRVHHSKIVKQWVKESKINIELIFLPSYSPKKNPDEYF